MLENILLKGTNVCCCCLINVRCIIRRLKGLSAHQNLNLKFKVLVTVQFYIEIIIIEWKIEFKCDLYINEVRRLGVRSSDGPAIT